MLILCYLGIKLANLLPLLAPLNPHQPNLHLCSTEAMASLPSHFFGPALRAPSPPFGVSSRYFPFKSLYITSSRSEVKILSL